MPDYDGSAVYNEAVGKEVLGCKFVEKNCPNLKEGSDALAEFMDFLRNRSGLS